MLLSFFSSTNYTTGIDYSSHPDCISVHNVEDFDSTRYTYSLDAKKKLKKEEKEIVVQPETQEEKKNRVLSSLTMESIEEEDITEEDIDNLSDDSLFRSFILPTLVEEEKKKLKNKIKSKKK